MVDSSSPQTPFTLPADYAAYQKEVIAFAKDQLDTSDLVDRDRDSTFSETLWRKCADFGIQGLAAPAEFGGYGEKIDIFRSVVAMEGLGYGCRDTGLVLALNAQMWTVQKTIIDFGTQEQKEKFLPPMVAGNWYGCHALTEKEAGSDVFSMQTTATKVDGGYLLNGTKRLVTLAPIADVALVFATTDPKLGKWGVTTFLVEKTSAGYRASSNKEKMGIRTAPFGEITFSDCFVPDENLLGKPGAGFSICNYSLEYDRCCMLSGKLGTMRRQFDETVAFVRGRKQFGKSIGEFQSISNRIADMRLRVELSRLLLYRVAALKRDGQPALMESSMLKLYLSESFVASSLDAVRIGGGSAYLTETGVERDLRDAVSGVIYAGTSDIQRNIIAKLSGI